jgi:hypothetical protein
MESGDEYDTVTCQNCHIRVTTVIRGTVLNPKRIPIYLLGWQECPAGWLCPVCAREVEGDLFGGEQ